MATHSPSEIRDAFHTLAILVRLSCLACSSSTGSRRFMINDVACAGASSGLVGQSIPTKVTIINIADG